MLNRVAEFVGRVACEPDSKVCGGAAVERETATRSHSDTAVERTRCPAVGGDSWLHVGPQCQTARGHVELKGATQSALEGVAQRISTFRVEPPRSPDVALYLLVLEEVADRGFERQAPLAVERRAKGEHRVEEIGRRDHPANANPRREDFGECADVDDHTSRVMGREGVHRLRIVVIFVVVVVFDHGHAVLGSPAQQPQTSAGVQRDRRRVLVMRRQIDRAWRGAVELLDADPTLVNIDAAQRGSLVLEGVPCRRVSQPFNRDLIPRLEESSGDQSERHLAPACDQDVVRSDGEATGMGKHGCDLLAEPRMASRVPILQRAAAGLSHHAAQGSGQQLSWDDARVGQPSAKIERNLGARASSDSDPVDREAGA